MDQFFEEGDIRAQVLEYLEKASFTEEESKEAVELYRGMCNLCFEKLKTFDGNPYFLLILNLLTETPTLRAAALAYEDAHAVYSEFSDLIVSIILLRRLEELGSASQPFTVGVEMTEGQEGCDA